MKTKVSVLGYLCLKFNIKLKGSFKSRMTCRPKIWQNEVFLITGLRKLKSEKKIQNLEVKKSALL